MCRPLIATTRIRQHHTTILHHCSKRNPLAWKRTRFAIQNMRKTSYQSPPAMKRKVLNGATKKDTKDTSKKPNADIVQENTSLCTRTTNPHKGDRSLAKATPRHNGTRTPNVMAHQTSHTSHNLRNNAATELNKSSRPHAAERAWTPAHFDFHHVLGTRDKHQGARTLHDIQPTSPAPRRLDGSAETARVLRKT